MAQGGRGDAGGVADDLMVSCAVESVLDLSVAVADPERLRALGRLGLTAAPDAAMEEFARWVRDSLGVPVALVSLVAERDQVFPGMVGLTGSWARRRSTPLTHSLCRHVVRTGRPLVVPDAREDPVVRDSLTVADLGVVAYAGMPLTDQDGRVLGALVAIDRVARAWSDAELRTLERIARSCCLDLRLRLSRFDHGVEEMRRDADDLARQRAFERSQTLLAASQQFTDTTTLDDVVTRIRNLITSALRPATVGIVVVDEQRRLRRLDELDPSLPSEFDMATRTPAARAIREARIVHHPDRTSFDAANSAESAALIRQLGVHTCVAVPIPGPDTPIGAMVLGWSHPIAVDATDLLTLASIAGYAGQAFTRADVLRHRLAVAYELQQAMLTTLPAIEGLSMAARYQPADAREHVGGDWYDAAPLPPVEPGARTVAMSVGDIVGHALDAATIMGQARSMLRQAAWDHPGGPPTAILRAFESANLGLDLRAAGTAVIAHLHSLPDGSWSMRWTNAGHPPPILVAPDGTVELLDEHDALFGFPALSRLPRLDHARDIPPGSTLVLYTDGLVEHRNHPDVDAGIDALVQLLRRIHDQPVPDLVDTVVATLAVDTADDVVVFAVRFA